MPGMPFFGGVEQIEQPKRSLMVLMIERMEIAEIIG
jgi:hypothetical protein